MYKNEPPESDIQAVYNTNIRKEAEENRRLLKPIISTVIFMGRNGLPFRGHRDDGKLQTVDETEDVDACSGKFRALLQFRVASGDSHLRQHLENCKGNATYISKTAQNSIISCISRCILAKLVSQVKEARFYAIMADETTDISRHEQNDSGYPIF